MYTYINTSTGNSSTTSTTTNNININKNNSSVRSQYGGLSDIYKNIIIFVGVLCLLIFIVVFTTLLYRCIKTKNIQRKPNFSIHNPVYQPDFDTENNEPTLYQDVDPQYNDNYIEIQESNTNYV